MNRNRQRKHAGGLPLVERIEKLLRSSKLRIIRLREVRLRAAKLNSRHSNTQTFKNMKMKTRCLITAISMSLRKTTVRRRTRIRLTKNRFNINRQNNTMTTVTINRNLTVRRRTTSLIIMYRMNMNAILDNIGLRTNALNDKDNRISNRFSFRNLNIVNSSLLTVRIRHSQAVIRHVLTRTFRFNSQHNSRITIVTGNSFTQRNRLTTPTIVLRKSQLRRQTRPTMSSLATIRVRKLQNMMIITTVPRTRLNFQLRFTTQLPHTSRMTNIISITIRRTTKLKARNKRTGSPLLITILIFSKRRIKTFGRRRVQVQILRRRTLMFPTSRILKKRRPRLTTLIHEKSARNRMPNITNLPSLQIAMIVISLINQTISSRTTLNNTNRLIIIQLNRRLRLPITTNIIITINPAITNMMRLRLTVITSCYKAKRCTILLLFGNQNRRS